VKNSTKENLLLWIVALVALVSVVVSDEAGMSQKWHAAIFWTACAFGPAAVGSRRRLGSCSFWASWTICLAAHIAAMWVTFGLVLGDYRVVSRLLTLPFAFGESILLLGLIPALERKLMRTFG
jgi:hypothetical protein